MFISKAFASDLPDWPEAFEFYEKSSKSINERLEKAIEFFQPIYNESKNIYESEPLVNGKADDIARFSDNEKKYRLFI